jgi:hypothetical protein
MPAIHLTPWRLRNGLFAAGLLAILVSGCADSPLQDFAYFNPWSRAQWEEDEQEITTYHRKIADLAALRSRAVQLPPAEREQVAFQLSERLKEEKSSVLRAELLRTLGEFPTQLAQHAILASMTDDAAGVRIAACKALGRQPTAEAFQALSQSVSGDADVDVRIAAARELGKFKGFEAPQALRPALDDRDPALQLAAMQSLQALTGRSEFRNSAPTWREFLDGGNPAPPPGPTVAEVVRQYWFWY